jgi:hypothetical protein
MKRSVAVAVALLVMSSAVYGQQESWGLLSLGIQRSSASSQTDADPQVGVGVVGVSAYRFGVNRNIGLFADATFLGPLALVFVDGESDLVSVPIVVSMVIGAGFRLDLHESFELRGGIGPDLGIGVDPDPDTGGTSYFVGLGSDIGAKLDLGEGAHLGFGTLVRYDLPTIGLEGAEATFTVRPYLGVGLNLVIENDQSRIGSP